MQLRRVVFLPGVMGSALNHVSLANGPQECRALIAAGVRRIWRADPGGGIVGERWLNQLGDSLCLEADTLWGRAGMLFQALDGDAWFELLADTDGISESGGAFIRGDGDGLTRIILPVADDLVPYDGMVARLRDSAVVDLHVHAYDWRLSNIHNAEGLAEAVTRRWRFSNPPTDRERIIIIAHSMGGLLARYYLESPTLNGALYVRHLITIGTPHDGAPELYTHMLGITQPLDPVHRAIAWAQTARGGGAPGHLLRPDLQQRLALRFASLIEALPVYNFASRGTRPPVPWEETLAGLPVDVPGGLSTPRPPVPSSGSWPGAGNNALPFVQALRSGLIPRNDLPHWLDCSRVSYTLLGAVGFPTVSGFDMRTGKPRRDMVGDGTVPLRSALLLPETPPPEEFLGKRPGQQFIMPDDGIRLKRRAISTRGSGQELFHAGQRDHQQLLRVPSVLAAVIDIVIGQNPEAGPAAAGPAMDLATLYKLAMQAGGHPKPYTLAVLILRLADPASAPALRMQGPDGQLLRGPGGYIGNVKTVSVDGTIVHRYAEFPSAYPSRTGREAGGIAVVPANPCSGQVELAGWNTLNGHDDNRRESNYFHAERQVLRWIGWQPARWRARIREIKMAVTRSPCQGCASDLAAVLNGKGLNNVFEIDSNIPLRPERATISWQVVYRHRSSTWTSTRASLAAMKTAHWHIDRRGRGLNYTSPLPPT